MKFARLTVFDDGSYLGKLYPSAGDRHKDINGIMVRVIEYQLKGGREKYVLITSIFPLRPAEFKKLRREIIDEIAQRKVVSSRGTVP